MDADHKLTDVQVLIAWQWGSAQAGREFFRRMFPMVNRYLSNKLGNQIDLEDLAQKTFVRCMESRARFEGRSTPRCWVVGIAHNLLREHYRAQRRSSSLDAVSVLSVRDLCDGPSTLVGKRREHHALLEALRVVPLETQYILELYYWEGFTGADLAELFRRPEGSVRTMLRAAKAKLLTVLRERPSSGVEEVTEEALDRWARGVRDALFGTFSPGSGGGGGRHRGGEVTHDPGLGDRGSGLDPGDESDPI